VLGVQPRLDPLGQVDLLLGGEQAGAADGLQVGVHRVAHRGRVVVEVGFQRGGAGRLRQHPGFRRGRLQLGQRVGLAVLGRGLLGGRALRLGRRGLSRLVAEQDPGLGQLPQDRPSFNRGDAGLLEGAAQLGQ
jgi:hypothetical protein